MNVRRDNWRRRPVFPLIRGPEGAERLRAEDRIDEVPEAEVVVAKGKAVPRTEADLAELALITDQDRDVAAEDWRDNTLPALAGLVDAIEEDEEG